MIDSLFEGDCRGILTLMISVGGGGGVVQSVRRDVTSRWNAVT